MLLINRLKKGGIFFNIISQILKEKFSFKNILIERRWKNLVVTLISMAYIFVGGGIFVLLGQGSARKLYSNTIFLNPKKRAQQRNKSVKR